MTVLLVDYLKAFGWGIVGAITMAISLWILLRVFTWLTPVDEWAGAAKGKPRDCHHHGCCDYWVCDCGRVDGRPSAYRSLACQS